VETLKPTNYLNPIHPILIEKSLQKGAKLSKDGALVVLTGKFTGRAAQDKYIVKDEITSKTIWWENNVGAVDADTFSKIKNEVIQFLNSQDLYESNRSVCADVEYEYHVDLFTNSPSHVLFSQYMFREPQSAAGTKPKITIYHAPMLELDAKKYNLKTGTAIISNINSKEIVICGTQYAGEVKKSIFSILNYLLPERGILPMHAGANVSRDKKSFVFFGLSGTGKTTLSTDIGFNLVGDDEHGLGANGIFNFEGGCYAKTYKLDPKAEPYIYNACTRFESFLENVVMDEKTRTVDFNDSAITENGRASYPLHFIQDRIESSMGPVPSDIFFLAADAFGVLPPVAKLNHDQALFYFLLGYTAKLAGTEAGVKEPSATFSSCFGAPFMIRHPHDYATLLKKYIQEKNINVWMINTGWTGGPYGVGERFSIDVTRKIIRSIQKDGLKGVSFKNDPYFNFAIPEKIEGLNQSTLFPEMGWKAKTNYSDEAKKLNLRFIEQVKKLIGSETDLIKL
jgi:phosphoenolpyruvate carboxykinase (ATP)